MLPCEGSKQLLIIDDAKLTAAMIPVGVISLLADSPSNDHILNGDLKIPDESDHVNFILADWCQRLVIGDVVNECMLWNKSCRDVHARALVKRIKAILHDDQYP